MHKAEQSPAVQGSCEHCVVLCCVVQGEMINESGTMSGGGGKPRGGRMCLGKAALASIDTQAAAAELQAAEQELETGAQVQCACQHLVLASLHVPMLLTVDLCHKGLAKCSYEIWLPRCNHGVVPMSAHAFKRSASRQPVPDRVFAAKYCASHRLHIPV